MINKIKTKGGFSHRIKNLFVICDLVKLFYQVVATDEELTLCWLFDWLLNHQLERPPSQSNCCQATFC